MRDKLENLFGKTRTFTAECEPLDASEGSLRMRPMGFGKIPHVCLRNVHDLAGNAVADHVWVPYRNDLEHVVSRTRRVLLKFRARVSSYAKGYLGSNPWKLEHQPPASSDYKLTSIQVLSHCEIENGTR